MELQRLPIIGKIQKKFFFSNIPTIKRSNYTDLSGRNIKNNNFLSFFPYLQYLISNIIQWPSEMDKRNKTKEWF